MAAAGLGLASQADRMLLCPERGVLSVLPEPVHGLCLGSAWPAMPKDRWRPQRQRAFLE